MNVVIICFSLIHISAQWAEQFLGAVDAPLRVAADPVRPMTCHETVYSIMWLLHDDGVLMFPDGMLLS